MKWALLPWIAPPGQIIHKLSAPFVLATLPTKSKKVKQTKNKMLRISSTKKMSLKFTLKRIKICSMSNVGWQGIP